MGLQQRRTAQDPLRCRIFIPFAQVKLWGQVRTLEGTFSQCTGSDKTKLESEINTALKQQ